MKMFTVKTHEMVEGTYTVEAETEEEARSAFGNPVIDWGRVAQREYMAFSCEIRSVEENVSELT